ncbi:hypothetical protein [Vibrio coralliilyticus]|uniref:hypothetical protein n=1 Tax=Vibrio coralliilyticus TaxID=190893 RepID=UPI0020B8343A|nr:hypothetical protein [Vibrio coralliilyticus]
MNKIRLAFAAFILIFIAMCSYVYMAYGELNKLAKYDEQVRTMGHEVIELRDEVIGASIRGISDPYQMANQLVELERELTEFQKRHQQADLHSTLFQNLPTQTLLNNFHSSAMSLAGTLDQTIGLIVAREFVLHSLKNKLMDGGGFRSDNQSLEQIISHMLDENAIGADEEVTRFAQTFCSGQCTTRAAVIHLAVTRQCCVP